MVILHDSKSNGETLELLNLDHVEDTPIFSNLEATIIPRQQRAFPGICQPFRKAIWPFALVRCKEDALSYVTRKVSPEEIYFFTPFRDTGDRLRDPKVRRQSWYSNIGRRMKEMSDCTPEDLDLEDLTKYELVKYHDDWNAHIDEWERRNRKIPCARSESGEDIVDCVERSDSPSSASDSLNDFISDTPSTGDPMDMNSLPRRKSKRLLETAAQNQRTSRKRPRLPSSSVGSDEETDLARSHPTTESSRRTLGSAIERHHSPEHQQDKPDITQHKPSDHDSDLKSLIFSQLSSLDVLMIAARYASSHPSRYNFADPDWAARLESMVEEIKNLRAEADGRYVAQSVAAWSGMLSAFLATTELRSLIKGGEHMASESIIDGIKKVAAAFAKMDGDG